MPTEFLTHIVAFLLGLLAAAYVAVSLKTEAKAQGEWYARLKEARSVIVDLSRRLGLMEQQRNHARWKAGVRRRKMREMREEIAALKAQVFQLLQPAREEFDKQVIAKRAEKFVVAEAVKETVAMQSVTQ